MASRNNDLDYVEEKGNEYITVNFLNIRTPNKLL